ncbi:MAG: thioredoxin domain-containing protein, partial [Pseudomonadota bacterium]
AHDSLLVALEDQLYPPQLIVLRGEGEPLKIWQARAQRFYAPRRFTLAIPNDARNLPGALAERGARGTVTAYVCTGIQCSAPITELSALETELGKTEAMGSS